MNFKEIKELIKLVGQSNLSEFKLKQKDVELSIKTDKYQKLSNATFAAAAPQVVASPVAAPAPTPVEKAAPAAAGAEKEEESSAGLLEVKSPIVGTFYRSSSPEKDPFVKVGDSISVGSVVCIVEAMKLFNEIESEVSGKIVKVLLDDSSPVEYDQVLFLVDPKG